MSNESYSAVIRKLAAQYYGREISFDEYRSQRRTLLGLIDQQYNSAELAAQESEKLNGGTITFKNPNYPF